MSTNALRHDEHEPSRIMTTTAQTISAHTKRQQSPLYPTDDEPTTAGKDKMVSVVQSPSMKMDKQSAEYLVKSGLAGGLAGCAVRSTCYLYEGNVNLMICYRQRQ